MAPATQQDRGALPGVDGWALALLVGWGAFAGYLVTQARGGPPIVWNDSRSYATVAARPLWSGAFWWGIRPPALPLLVKAVGDGGAVVVSQTVIAAVAWGALAWVVAAAVPRGWRRVVAGWSVLAFATVTPLVQWNRSELSESLALSAQALLVAAVLHLARAPSWRRVGVVVLAAVPVALVRDAMVWTVLLVGVGALVAGAAVHRRHRGWARRWAAAGVGLVLVAVAAGAALSASHRSVQNVTDVYEVRVFPFPDRVAWFTGHGMPEGRAVDLLAAGTVPSPQQATVVAVPSTPPFAPLRRWLRDDGGGTYLEFLVTHPGVVVGEPLVRPERTFNNADGDLASYGPVEAPLHSPVTPVGWPAAPWLGALAAVGLALGAAAWRRSRAVWVAAVGLGLVGLVSMVVAWHGDGQEVTRHTVEGFALLRLAVWVTVLVGALGWTGPLRSRAVPTAALPDQVGGDQSGASTVNPTGEPQRLR